MAHSARSSKESFANGSHDESLLLDSVNALSSFHSDPATRARRAPMKATSSRSHSSQPYSGPDTNSDSPAKDADLGFLEQLSGQPSQPSDPLEPSEPSEPSEPLNSSSLLSDPFPSPPNDSHTTPAGSDDFPGGGTSTAHPSPSDDDFPGGGNAQAHSDAGAVPHQDEEGDFVGIVTADISSSADPPTQNDQSNVLIEEAEARESATHQDGHTEDQVDDSKEVDAQQHADEQAHTNPEPATASADSSTRRSKEDDVFLDVGSADGADGDELKQAGRQDEPAEAAQNRADENDPHESPRKASHATEDDNDDLLGVGSGIAGNPLDGARRYPASASTSTSAPAEDEADFVGGVDATAASGAAASSSPSGAQSKTTGASLDDDIFGAPPAAGAGENLEAELMGSKEEPPSADKSLEEEMFGKSSPSVQRNRPAATSNLAQAELDEEERREDEPEERKRLRRKRKEEKAAKMQAAQDRYRSVEAQRTQEQEDRRRMEELYGERVDEWLNKHRGNIRSMLASLHEIVGDDIGWKRMSMGDLVTSAAVKKAYYKAQLIIHPDKVTQRGGDATQKFLANKLFHELQDAYNAFRSNQS